MDTKNFDILPDEKRKAVINAALACFGKSGYKKTAMSEIASEANISKAALFHYFGTKRDLYFFLFHISSDEFLTKQESGTEDFFECVEMSMRIKMKVMDKYPAMFDFLTSLVCEDDKSVTDELQAAYGSRITAWVERLIANVDWSRLREGISKEEAQNLVNWISDKYIETYRGIQDRETMAVELKRYWDLLKTAVYKGEYL